MPNILSWSAALIFFTLEEWEARDFTGGSQSVLCTVGHWFPWARSWGEEQTTNECFHISPTTPIIVCLIASLFFSSFQLALLDSGQDQVSSLHWLMKVIGETNKGRQSSSCDTQLELLAPTFSSLLSALLNISFVSFLVASSWSRQKRSCQTITLKLQAFTVPWMGEHFCSHCSLNSSEYTFVLGPGIPLPIQISPFVALSLDHHQWMMDDHKFDSIAV